MPRLTGAILMAIGGMLAGTPAYAQAVVTRGEELSIDISAERDQLAFNLLGNLWTVRGSGGVASLLADVEGAARNPAWSPDSQQIAYEAGGFGGIQILDVDTGERRRASPEAVQAQDPGWHPSGERLIYSGRQEGSQFDLWELDVTTGLRWRVTHSESQDLEASWSPDGKDLAWIRQSGDEWQLMVRYFGQPDTVLRTSGTPLRAPSWRPDGTLLTFFAQGESGFELKMLILADPPLERTLVREEGLYPSRISWQDRSSFYYAAKDRIKQREFDDWSGRIINFRASLGAPEATPMFAVANRNLPVSTPADRPLVIRAGRIFDGRGRDYRTGVDVLVADGLIAEITEQKDWADILVINLPTTTLMPGLIDTYAAIPESLSPEDGASLLAWGITTMVARLPEGFDASVWETESSPGPRLLPAVKLDDDVPSAPYQAGELPYLVIDNSRRQSRGIDEERVAAWQSLGIPVVTTSWQRAGTLSTALFLAADPVTSAAANSQRMGRESGARVRLNLATRQLLSGLADASTPGLRALFAARQAQGLTYRQPGPGRRPLLPDLRRSSAPVALASGANRYPSGLATHAELLALADGKLTNNQVLGAAGRQAARILGLSGKVGEISVGASADMILVSGDPLAEIHDLRNVVAVVRNGRFFSLINLLERR